MYEKKVLEELELSDSIVWSTYCLLSFNTRNSNSNMSCSNHIDIICSITNC
jgi:hypothetical protein